MSLSRIPLCHGTGSAAAGLSGSLSGTISDLVSRERSGSHIAGSTAICQWLDFLDNTAAYEPIQFYIDYCCMLGGMDTPYLDHLGEITVPVFDLGGAGGLAPDTEATLSYLGGDDVTQLYVSIGASEAQLEYGHIDIFTGWNAVDLVWQPALEWVQITLTR